MPPSKIPLPDTSLSKKHLGGTKAQGWREEKAGINLIIAPGRLRSCCVHEASPGWLLGELLAR